MRDDWPTQSWVHPFRPAGLLVLLAHAIDHGGHRRVAKWLASFATRKNELALEPSGRVAKASNHHDLAVLRGGVFPNSTAIAEISGFMKKASLAG